MPNKIHKSPDFWLPQETHRQPVTEIVVLAAAAVGIEPARGGVTTIPARQHIHLGCVQLEYKVHLIHHVQNSYIVPHRGCVKEKITVIIYRYIKSFSHIRIHNFDTIQQTHPGKPISQRKHMSGGRVASPFLRCQIRSPYGQISTHVPFPFQGSPQVIYRLAPIHHSELSLTETN